MSVLAIDTASRGQTVCVLADTAGDLLGTRLATGDAVAQTLPAAIRAMLDGRLEAVVAVLGPGSYTGVRAGIAGAVGVAAALDLPLHGVGSLEIVAAGWHPAGRQRAVAVREAGRGAVYLADVEVTDGSQRSGTPRLVARLESGGAGVPLLTVDGSLCPPAEPLDHPACLAAGVRLALARPPLSLHGVQAVYVG